MWNSGGPPPGTGTDVTPDASSRRSSCCSSRPCGSCSSACRTSSGAPPAASSRSLARREGADAHLALSNTFRPALTGWLKTLADELGPQGITVNCVAPGRIATPRLEQLYPDGPRSETRRRSRCAAGATPREFGDVVCFLASDRARYVSGQTIVVDGGLQRSLF